jgi:hypothetical protein
MASIKIRDQVLLDCIEYMKQMHEGQFRRITNAPYAIHLLDVLDLMEESPFFFATRDKCAALLHDVKEDSPKFSWDELVKRFGHYVAGAVAMLSKSKLGEQQPEVYFAMLQHAHPNIIAIKLLDRIDNTSEFNITTDERWLEKYCRETIELVLPLIQIMVARGSAISPQGYYELGTWIEDRLQRNLHGMEARIRELRQCAARRDSTPPAVCKHTRYGKRCSQPEGHSGRHTYVEGVGSLTPGVEETER